jgi:hypothetical protein
MTSLIKALSPRLGGVPAGNCSFSDPKGPQKKDLLSVKTHRGQPWLGLEAKSHVAG